MFEESGSSQRELVQVNLWRRLPLSDGRHLKGGSSRSGRVCKSCVDRCLSLGPFVDFCVISSRLLWKNRTFQVEEIIHDPEEAVFCDRDVLVDQIRRESLSKRDKCCRFDCRSEVERKPSIVSNSM